MPFKSEAQRKYLWANEPEIARDWTDTYGSRIQKAGGQLVQPGPGRPGYQGDRPPGVTGRETGGGYSDRERGQQQAADRRTRDLGPGWQTQVSLPSPKVTPKDDGMISKFKNWQNTSNIGLRSKWLHKNIDRFDIDELVRRNLVNVHSKGDLPPGTFGESSLPVVGYTAGSNLGTPAACDYLKDIGGYKSTPTGGGGGGGGGQSYTTAGGAGTTTPTD
ncbi:MAG TPA: hypothetical protein EYN67_07650, partial [Flavobacteriales bacterium]|nr:hypothetical protein [Flavobacteriales bacterium]